MDGRYLSNSYPFTEVHKVLIEEWIQGAIANKSWEEDLDIHVDEICKDGRYKKYWIPLSISLVYHANKFLQEINTTDIIGVVDMPLYANAWSKMGFDFKKLEDIRAAFDLTPPLLYLAPKDFKICTDEYQHYGKLASIFIDDSQFDILAYEKLWTTNHITHIRQISLLPADHKIKLSI